MRFKIMHPHPSPLDKRPGLLVAAWVFVLAFSAFVGACFALYF